MTDRPTPLTDAERIASGHEGCPATYLHHTFCEDLERKLAEARGVMQAATVLIAAKGRHNTKLAYDGLREALARIDAKGKETA